MDLPGWNARYALGEDDAAPTPLVVETVRGLRPGRALDLACGAGRNALWLAEHGWHVTAVDGASAAIETLEERARRRAVAVTTREADLRKQEFAIVPDEWDLIAICYYLQRDLFAPAKRGVKPGGLLLAIAHIAEEGEDATEHRLWPGELRRFFDGWRILHDYEGAPSDPAHRRAVAEIVAERVVK